mgnify:CR=1 FL=1
MDKIYQEENQYLQIVNSGLKEELEKLKDELKKISEQKVSYDDAKRGEQFVKADLMENYGKRIYRLNNVASSPYFGRMDFKQNGSIETKKIYIGRTSLSKNGEMLIVDWRSPISSMYYNNSNGMAQYDAPQGTIEGDIELKRQIVIEDYEIKNILDTDIVTNDEILQEYLNIHADEKMKNIIASIQEEQNDIIRKPLNKNVIVQGVAGSGKTSVALHRIAYLLYNVKDSIKNDDFLLLGPNNYFLDYISSVLPELETEPIKQKRYLDFTSDYIDEKITLSKNDYIPKTGNEKELYERIKKYKNSLEYKDSIDRFMEQYLEGNFVEEGISFDGVDIFDKKFVKNALLSGVITKINFDRAKDITLARFDDNKDNIYSYLRRKYKEIYTSETIDEKTKKEAKDKSMQLYDLIYKKGDKKIKDYYKKLNKKISDIYSLFLNNIEKYAVDLKKEAIDMLKKMSLNNSGKKKLSIEDLPALNYIKYLLSGKVTTYKQIAIDEAQDYGLFHYYSLLKICPKANFSIYGDLAQSIYPYTNIPNWEILVDKVFKENCEITYLNKSYRTTREITDNANLVLNTIGLDNAESVERHGKEVEYHKMIKPEVKLKETIHEWLESDYKSVGVICKTEKEALKLYKSLVKDNIPVTYLDDTTSKYEGGVYVTTSIASKGLEFDAVIINDASSDVYDSNNSMDMHLLYVALTRALHELKILYSHELTDALTNKSRNKVKTR